MIELAATAPGVRLLPLGQEHLDDIVGLMNQEGWYYYDRLELARYLALDQACFVLVRDGRARGSLFSTNYGNQAWLGNIIVAGELRGQGLAGRMIRAVIDHLQETANVGAFRLGSVPLAIGLYKRLGFKPEAFVSAQEAELPLKAGLAKVAPSENIRVEKLGAGDLEAAAALDERYFKSNRLALLQSLYSDSLAGGRLCLKDRGRLVGFLLLRRRQASKSEGGFAEGPEQAFRLGPAAVLPEYGLDGFKALFQEAIPAVNAAAAQRPGGARIYAVLPKNADKREIYRDTAELARPLGLGGAAIDLDRVFNEHDHIFGAPASVKDRELSDYLAGLGFHQEYFEQVMSYTPGEPPDLPPGRRQAEATRADPAGIFAAATPGDKA